MHITAGFKDKIIDIRQMVDNLKILQAERTLKNHPDSELSRAASEFRTDPELIRVEMVLHKRGRVLPVRAFLFAEWAR